MAVITLKQTRLIGVIFGGDTVADAKRGQALCFILDRDLDFPLGRIFDGIAHQVFNDQGQKVGGSTEHHAILNIELKTIRVTVLLHHHIHQLECRHVFF